MINQKLFIKLGDSLFRMFGIPVRVFKKNKLIAKFEQYEIGEEFLRALFSDEPIPDLIKLPLNVRLSIAPNFLTFGIVNDKINDRHMIIGPSRASAIVDSKVKEMLVQHNLDLAMQKQLSTYINSIPIMQVGRFACILSNVNISVNQEYIEPAEIYTREFEHKIDSTVLKNIINYQEHVVYNDIIRQNSYDFEKRLLYCVKNGMTGSLKKLWAGVTQYTYIAINTNILRDAKNDLILSIGIMSRAAMQGGFDSETAYQLCEIYMQRAENCNGIKEVAQLKYNMMVDFCERVRELHYMKTENPAINRAIKYIIENVEKKIHLKEIADMLHISDAYLSTKFKEATGMPLPDFINLQKTNEAKRILLFTDKPLIEIANYLSFSSQSYFQSIFKKVTGMTPAEFRRSGGE